MQKNFLFRCFKEIKAAIMQIPQISFGKKIPIKTCTIQDIRQNKQIDAKIFQYDCWDKTDIDEVRKVDKNFRFARNIVANMEMEEYYIRKHNRSLNYSFYTMEINDEIIGLAQIEKLPTEILIEYLESEHNKNYKYIGQNFINMLNAMALKEHYEKLRVPAPLNDAYGFYYKYGFKKVSKWASVELSRIGMLKLKYKNKFKSQKNK